jgi:metal transporter CNNM
MSTFKECSYCAMTIAFVLIMMLPSISFRNEYLFQVLDYLLGHDEALFRRAQLKALVSIHGKEV